MVNTFFEKEKINILKFLQQLPQGEYYLRIQEPNGQFNPAQLIVSQDKDEHQEKIPLSQFVVLEDIKEFLKKEVNEQLAGINIERQKSALPWKNNQYDCKVTIV